MSRPFSCPSRDSGSILVLAIWVLVFFSILCVALAGIVSSQIRLAKRTEDEIICKYLAKAVVVYARWEREMREVGYDTLYDLTQERERELGIGKFVYTLTDEESKINVNSAAAEVIASLPGFNLELAEKVNASISKPFRLKEEILLIDGVTEEIFEQCRDFITVYSSGKLNINTASATALEAIGMEEQLANTILDFREGSDSKEATADDGIFENTGDIISRLRAFRSLSEAEESTLASLISQGIISVESRNFSMQIDTSVVGKPAMSYVVVMDEEKIKQWTEY